MKKNIEWYPHRKDSHRHPKFKMLRTLYGDDLGWAMEGRFWALNNLIADAEECKLDLSKTRNKALIADELGLSIIELDNFINNLICPDVELLFKIDNNIYSTKKVKEAFDITCEDRQKARVRQNKTSHNITPTAELLENSGELSQNSGELLYTVKNSKVKNSKEHNSKVREVDVDNSKNNLDKTNASLPLPLYDFKSLPSFTFTLTNYLHSPIDFDNDNEVVKSINFLFKDFTNILLTKSEESRLLNIIKNFKKQGVRKQTSFSICLEFLQNFNALTPEKKNLKYISKTIEDKITDALIRAREKIAIDQKLTEKREIEVMAKNPNNLIADYGIEEIMNKMSVS